MNISKLMVLLCLALNVVSLKTNFAVPNSSTFDDNFYIVCPGVVDAEALMAIYNALDGPNWKKNDGWDADCDICNWEGIKCDNSGRVTELKLKKNDLIGFLPPEIGDLTFLEKLDLSDNDIIGELPPEISNLINLTQLKLKKNKLEGCIPASFSIFCSINVDLNENSCLSHSGGDFASFCAGDPCDDSTDQERDALIAFYNALDGTNWKKNDGWDDDCDKCKWHGVKCDNSGRVTELKLKKNDLSGLIPAQIGSLTYLEKLDLSDNNLSGSIPSEIANLSNLTQLKLQKNNLEGCIPPSFSTICAINVDLSDNLCLLPTGGFTAFCAGTFCDPNIAIDKSALVALYDATDGSNWIDNTNWLQTCDVCTWYGVTCDANSRIVELDLSANGLSGILPAEIGNLSELRVLNLSGTASPAFRSPEDIKDITKNAQGDGLLTGAIPPEIGNLSQLEVLDLSNNNFTDTIPSEIADIPNLTILNLSDNSLEGCIPVTFSVFCGTLNPELNFNECLSHDQGDFNMFCQDPNANSCEGSNVTCSTCTDSILNGTETEVDCGGICVPCDCEHPDYNALLDFYNATNGSSWTDNSGWADDSTYNCDPCTWPGVICDAQNRVIIINLSNNGLTGGIPTEIENLTSLSQLILSNNNITDTLPSSIGNLSNLIDIMLQMNAISGEIPESLGTLSALDNLDLSNNNLTGSIPESLGQLTGISDLKLSNNSLTGSIPESIADINNPRSIHLNNNDLSGCIPTSLTPYCGLQVAGIDVVMLENNPCLSHNEGDFSSFCSATPCEGSNPTCITCTNGTQDGTEEDIDCGGICTPCPCTHPDYNALLALYNATDGPNWTNSTDWVSDTTSSCDPCTWFGVVCNANNRVTELNIDGNGLIGQLPSEIGNFSFLERLNLSGNDLNSTLPPELGNLTNLKFMAFENGMINGQIPSEIGNLSQLEALFLLQNNLSGPIPLELGNLTNLQFLSIGSNQLTDTLPASLGQLSNIIVFSIGNTLLEGEIPTELSGFPNLSYLDLSNSSFRGNVSKNITFFGSGIVKEFKGCPYLLQG